MHQPPKICLDANVLWSPQQRNLLLQMASRQALAVFWSWQIEEEWLRNTTPVQRNRLEAGTLPIIRYHFPEAILETSGENADTGMTSTSDRHVALTAIAGAPCTLLTWNIRHFDRAALARGRVALQTPDHFLSEIFDAQPAGTFDLAKEAWSNLRKSAPDWEAWFERLTANRLTGFVHRLREFRA